ncbi:16S rRNA pseudouridine(516) synthase [Shewanella saliphila]|uniref:Pseudouridine synthase n=1 Tax=Shewanella saliphila TaxID=2282698 RepID=A0ABQ2Q8H2_9GAMM|nr:16S rRNA pseudouridine(516) synthase [Shewanella saliphila]MCL1100053.1 16S rRNA pseudouridine(516) synthase [Shewanella saliphila]GGP62389.1 pseudouridine synthase [Shewanella saliphila]
MASKRGRLDQFIARRLQVSKKAVRQLLIDNKVSVDGKYAKSPDLLIDEFSHIVCNDVVLQQYEKQYYMLNKPDGVVSATVDDKHPTAVSLLVGVELDMLHIAGRLDLHSTGLLLITNDAKWSAALMAPDNKVDKHYIVTLANPIDERYIDAFANGMYFEYEDITTLPATLTMLSSHQARVSLCEGKYHQIKRMFGRFRNPVVGLHRESIGKIVLDNTLLPGEFRLLTEAEIDCVIQ